ncbi:hypothetical protein [Sphingomonas aerophila]|uniref:Uncharacterized protein n=1 Tax=Sphingomonas aerophila TaxID=1344948 RepID=A0A7W9EVS6_9SPHN|nr:hypothetical protein [Sphingomonas aerophila]MBB5714788.1 hypothetical protein [Sphingomonas aerophila]
MPKLPRRLPYEAIILAGLLLGSCEDRLSPKRIAEQADVADVNARNALARVSELESRVSEIERKLNH